jgi:hypothetical protein
MYWHAELAYPITPKSGPLRAMHTLLDANRALTQDLPKGWLKQPRWAAAGKILVAAGERGLPGDIRAATEVLVAAIEREGWLDSPAQSPDIMIEQSSATETRLETGGVVFVGPIAAE